MSLSDKRGLINLDDDGNNMFAYHESDVRKAVLKLKRYFNKKTARTKVIYQVIDEIFGKELIA